MIKKLRRLLTNFFYLSFSKEFRESRRLKSIHRYKQTQTTLLGRDIVVADGPSFVAMHREIFLRQMYKFPTRNESPLIIDAGANIGIATIFFKTLYPKAKVIAFEPDTAIYDILVKNVLAFKLSDVQCVNKGLWNKSGFVSFNHEGADSGRISGFSSVADNGSTIEVESLRQYLQVPVDFLKVDIEGAEVEVLDNVKDLLGNVRTIFVEYHSFDCSGSRLFLLIEILRDAGFKIYVESGGSKSKNPYMEIKLTNGLANLLNIFGFRS